MQLYCAILHYLKCQHFVAKSIHFYIIASGVAKGVARGGTSLTQNLTGHPCQSQKVVGTWLKLN